MKTQTNTANTPEQALRDIFAPVIDALETPVAPASELYRELRTEGGLLVARQRRVNGRWEDVK